MHSLKASIKQPFLGNQTNDTKSLKCSGRFCFCNSTHMHIAPIWILASIPSKQSQVNLEFNKELAFFHKSHLHASFESIGALSSILGCAKPWQFPASPSRLFDNFRSRGSRDLHTPYSIPGLFDDSDLMVVGHEEIQSNQLPLLSSSPAPPPKSHPLKGASWSASSESEAKNKHHGVTGKRQWIQFNQRFRHFFLLSASCLQSLETREFVCHCCWLGAFKFVVAFQALDTREHKFEQNCVCPPFASKLKSSIVVLWLLVSLAIKNTMLLLNTYLIN